MEYFPTTTTTFKPPRTLEGKLVIAQVNIDLGKNMHRKQHLYSHLYHLDFSSSIMLWCVQQQLQQPGGSFFKKKIYIYIFKYVYVDTFLWVGTRKYNSHTHTSFFKNIFWGTSHQIINTTTATSSIASVFWTFLNQHPTFIQLRFFGLLDGEASTHGPLCPWHQKKPARLLGPRLLIGSHLTFSIQKFTVV